MNNKEIKQYAIAFVGQDAVGKSAITNQFTYNRFVEIDPTLEDTYRKQCVVDGEVVQVEVFDPAYQEDYTPKKYWAKYVKQWDGVILVYSVTSRVSFDVTKTLQQEVLECVNRNSFPMALMANKSDVISERQVDQAEGEELGKEFGCIFFEGSAKTGKNIDECFYELIREIKKSRKEPILLPDAKHDGAQRNNGCCNGCVML